MVRCRGDDASIIFRFCDHTFKFSVGRCIQSWMLCIECEAFSFIDVVYFISLLTMCLWQGNEKVIYEFVVRHFLACCSKDAQGQETSVEIDVNSERVNVPVTLFHVVSRRCCYSLCCNSL